MTQALEDDSTTLIIPGPDEIAIKLEPLALSNLQDSEDRKYFNTCNQKILFKKTVNSFRLIYWRWYKFVLTQKSSEFNG